MQTGAIVALVLFGSLVRVQEEVREQASASAGQARTTEVQVLDETSVAPWAIKQARPKYPKAAFDKKLQGEVVIEFLIDTKGRVAKTRVVQSVPGLDEAAVECLKKWRFKPAVKDGKPVAVIARAPMVFRIF